MFVQLLVCISLEVLYCENYAKYRVPITREMFASELAARFHHAA